MLDSLDHYFARVPFVSHQVIHSDFLICPLQTTGKRLGCSHPSNVRNPDVVGVPFTFVRLDSILLYVFFLRCPLQQETRTP